MEMSGERHIAAPRELVWQALNDAAALKAALPGCEALEKVTDTDLTAKLAIKIGPMAAKFAAKVKLDNLIPPESYTITGEGNGGSMGFAKGGADVHLEVVSANDTLLRYHVKAQVGGKMAQLGARLIDSSAKQMADQFFDRFAAALAPAAAEAPPPPAPSHAHISLLSLIPANIFGMPIFFWIGSTVMLVVLYLLFLST